MLTGFPEDTTNMGFADAVRTALSRYATFDGRATRPEFWWFALFYFLVQLAAGVLDVALFPNAIFGVVAPLVSLALLLPTLAVTARRLHDTDLSGWWQLISLVPVLGFIALIVLCVRPGTAGPNRFGPPSLPTPDGGTLIP